LALFLENKGYIASSNYAAIFEYGQLDAIIHPMFDQENYAVDNLFIRKTEVCLGKFRWFGIITSRSLLYNWLYLERD